MTAPPKALSLDALKDWLKAEAAKQFEWGPDEDDVIRCRRCGDCAVPQILMISFHFGDSCAGAGEVDKIDVPLCPNCEPDAPSHIYTCAHSPPSL
jgi:hypothetical protein